MLASRAASMTVMPDLASTVWLEPSGWIKVILAMDVGGSGAEVWVV
jgi:hypothetical protein